MRARVSRKLSEEMRQLVERMRVQVAQNAESVSSALRRANYLNLIGNLSTIVSTILNIYRTALGIQAAGEITNGDILGIVGDAVSEAGFSSNIVLGFEEIDVSCADDFDNLIAESGLDRRLDEFDERFVALGKYFNGENSRDFLQMRNFSTDS